MGKAKIIGGGSGINIKNGTRTEKYAAVNPVPANTFVQNIYKGLNLYKNCTEMLGFGPDESIATNTMKIMQLNETLFVLAYVDRTEYKFYVRTATLDKATYTLNLNNKFDCNYPGRASISYPTMILKRSDSSVIVIHEQYAYVFNVLTSGVLTLESTTQIIERGQVLAADYDAEKQRVAIAQHYSEFISSYTYYKYVRTYSVGSGGLTELSNAYISSSSANCESNHWNLKFLAPTTFLLSASTSTTASASSQLHLISVDLQTGTLSYDAIKRLNVTGLIYNMYILDSDRLVVVEKLQSSNYAVYARLGTISQGTITWDDYKLVTAGTSQVAISGLCNNTLSIIVGIAQYDFRCDTFAIDSSSLNQESSRVIHMYPVRGTRCNAEILEESMCIMGYEKGITLFVMSDRDGVVNSCEFVDGVTISQAIKTAKGKVCYSVGGAQ